MNVKEFFYPDLRKIAVTLIIILIGWFSIDSFWNLMFYFCHSCLIQGRCPLYCSVLELKNSNLIISIPLAIGLSYLVACGIVSVANAINRKYRVEEMRGMLWRKLKSEEVERRMKREEEISEESIEEKERRLKEEEERIKKEKEKFYEYLDELNTKKLKEIGLDIKENKIRCSVCKRWKSIRKDQLLDLIKEHGISIIWKYVCRDCRKKFRIE